MFMLKSKNKEEKTTEPVSSEQPTTEATTSTEATKDTPKPEVPADVEDKPSEDTSEETTEETTEETPEEPKKPFDKENTYLTLASYENDYGYDTYHTDDEIFQNKADKNHSYGAPSFSCAKTTTDEHVANRFLFTFNVKHSFVKDINPSIGYVNTKKAWIYDKNRTMKFKITNEWSNAETITKDYISNFVKINATNLQTGEEVENPFVEKVVNYLEVANSIYLEFTEGYYYKVTLNDALLERKNGKLYTKDLEYYFIVTNSLEKINKPIFPEQIKVDVKERLDEDGNTRIDYRVPFTEEVLQTYNKWEYANVTFSNKDIPSYSSIIVKNISDANVYWEMPEYEQVAPDKWKVIGKIGSFYPQLDKYGVLTAKESEFLKELQEQKYRLLVTDTFGYFHTINYEYK